MGGCLPFDVQSCKTDCLDDNVASLPAPTGIFAPANNEPEIRGNFGMLYGVWSFIVIKIVNLSLLNLAIAAGRQEKRPKMKLVDITICKTKGRVKILLREV